MRISDWSSDVCSSDLPSKIRAKRPNTASVSATSPGRKIASRTSANASTSAHPITHLHFPPRVFPWLRRRQRRSAERRVGKECVRQCRSQRAPYHKKTTINRDSVDKVYINNHKVLNN